MHDLNLKEVEQKAWLTVFEDGLIEIWLGWQLLWWGVMYLLTRTDLSTAPLTTINMTGYTLGVLALLLGKWRISLPRTGRVRFSRLRLRKIAWMGILLFVLVNGTFALTVLAVSQQESLLGESLSPFVSPLMLGIFFLLLFGLPGLILQHKRLYLVAILFAQGEITRTAFREFWGLDWGSFVFRAAGAAIIFALGFYSLRRFLHSHPILELPEGGSEHGE